MLVSLRRIVSVEIATALEFEQHAICLNYCFQKIILVPAKVSCGIEAGQVELGRFTLLSKSK